MSLSFFIYKMEPVPTNSVGGKISDNKYEVPGSIWDVAGLQWIIVTIVMAQPNNYSLPILLWGLPY